jgi:hypothetical protein
MEKKRVVWSSEGSGYKCMKSDFLQSRSESGFVCCLRVFRQAITIFNRVYAVSYSARSESSTSTLNDKDGRGVESLRSALGCAADEDSLR